MRGPRAPSAAPPALQEGAALLRSALPPGPAALCGCARYTGCSRHTAVGTAPNGGSFSPDTGLGCGI